MGIASERGGRFALPSSRAGRRLEARHVAAEDVPVELRGAGQASRQVNNFCSPDAFEADRLIAVEVLTPAGNWSSYPPHKHDEDIPGVETALEEIYYFEVARDGFGYQRVYGSGPGREIDITAEVRTGDVIVMPHGYHGPSMAAPGYDLYYLNVMAGPGERAWRFTDDPEHAWIRDTLGRAGARSARAADAEEARMRLTVAQALVRFLAAQYTERDGVEQRLIAGCFGIFGHGNVAGVGQALLESSDLPYYQARNEQGMVHTAVGYARMKNRLSTLACTSSIGPGATNMVTGAALATINRLPVLLLPGDLFATARPAPCCRNSRTRSRSTSRSTTASVPSRASSIASTVPSSCPRVCWRRCGC